MTAGPEPEAAPRPRRRRIVVAASILAFVAAFVGISIASKSSPGNSNANVAGSSVSPGPAPSALWYWTMAVAPSNPDTLVLGSSSGLFRSGDGGTSWQTVGPKDFEATSLAVAGSTMLAGGVRASANTEPIVRTAAGRTGPNGAGILLTSSDGGVTWASKHPHGLPATAIQALAVMPGRSSVIDALLTDGRLYQSTDGGTRFALISTHTEKTPWAIALAGPGHLVAGDMDTGSYVSSNGRTWTLTPFHDSRGGRMVMEYATQPNDPSHVLMSAYGVDLSTNDGATWRQVLKTDVMFGPVAFSESAPSIAYAVGFDSSLWRSSNGGLTWTQVH